jgi:anti-anti-sigma factor
MQETLPPLALEGALTIYRAQELKEQLMSAVQTNPELHLDLSQVTEIDSSGLQVLYLAKREAARANHALRIVAHSDAVREVFDLCNMNAYFGDPTLIPAQKPCRQPQ